VSTIDADVLAAYNAGIEKNRLRSGLGLVEFARTCEILTETLPAPPAVIYDIGGGYGEYAWWLAARGYTVSLFDISERNIEMSADLAAEYPKAQLTAAEIADARNIAMPDESADAILLLGPLYHITEYGERLAALRESFRLLKPGGLIFTAAITRYATLLWATTVYGERNELLGDADFIEMVERELRDGQHIKKTSASYAGMGRSYFHLPRELADEIEAAGFVNAEVRGVIGASWLVPNLDEQWKDPKRRENILRTVRMTEKEDAVLGLSTHILAIAEKPR
jgi:SAM-dependent methyltransferase